VPTPNDFGLIHVEDPLSEIPKSENLKNLKLSACQHEYSAVQMWILVNKINAQFEVVNKFNAQFVFIP
jgi:hypothetical protein